MDNKDKIKQKISLYKNERSKKQKVNKQAKDTEELFKKIIEMKRYIDKEQPPLWLIENRYSKIKEKYPFLYDKICSGNVDMKMLTMLFTIKQQVDMNNISSESADKYVGEYMADKYVNPLVDKLDKN